MRVLPRAEVEATTRAERTKGIQPALALGFCEAVGRPQRDSLFNEICKVIAAQTVYMECLSWQLL